MRHQSFHWFAAIDVDIGFGPWLSLRTKFESLVLAGLGLEPRLLGPVVGLEGAVLAKDYIFTVFTDTYMDFQK